MLSIFGLIPTILTFLTGLGGTVSKISGDITSLQLAKEKTKSDTEIKSIDAQISELHDRKDVLVAEAGNRINGIIRALLTIPALFILFKLMVIDKVIGSLAGCAGEAGKDTACHIFLTDPLDSYQWGVLTAVIGFYFLTSAFGKK